MTFYKVRGATGTKGILGERCCGGGGEGEKIVRKRRRFILLPHCCCIFRLKYYNKDEILADYLLHIPAQLCYNSSV